MSENMKINDIDGNVEVLLGEEAFLKLEDSYECIIFLFYNDNLVMTFDSKRKVWKFPSGQKGKHETTIECVTREAFEKTGAILENVFPIGYYIATKDNIMLKTAVFGGITSRFETRPEWCEADLVKLFDELPYDVSANKIYNMVLNYIKSEY